MQLLLRHCQRNDVLPSLYTASAGTKQLITISPRWLSGLPALPTPLPVVSRLTDIHYERFGAIMARAFMRLRPVFRERGKISAEVTGRLGETLGGIRIVKAYTAEDREDGVFAAGVERLFQNVRQTLTGISAVTAFGSLVIGAIGAIMILIGGRSILAGTMTLGDLLMYILFVGLLAAPLIQMSSIGTQLSEALAGLDRIREIKAMATEDDEDESREPLGTVRGDVASS
jgi:subfamily B ATP-binding cassette protein MsbA